MSELIVKPAVDPPCGYQIHNIKSDYRRLFPVGRQCAIMTMPLFLALPDGDALPPVAVGQPLRLWKDQVPSQALIFHESEWVPAVEMIPQIEEMDVFARRAETAHRMLKGQNPASDGAYKAGMTAALTGRQDMN